MTITRSTGISPGFPYMGPLPGGGYHGLTDELDALVVQAAELLVAEYGRDVEIRYNSDRRSGGAWVKDGPTHNTLVGLGARVRRIAPEGMSQGVYLEQYKTLPEETVIDTYVAKAALQDWGLDNGRGYCSREHDSLARAMVWLRVNVKVQGAGATVQEA